MVRLLSLCHSALLSDITGMLGMALKALRPMTQSRMSPLLPVCSEAYVRARQYVAALKEILGKSESEEAQGYLKEVSARLLFDGFV